MDATVAAIMILFLLVLAGAAVWYMMRQRNSQRLRQRFGPEYDKTVERFNSQDRAEKELIGREKRISKYTIIALPKAEQARYQDSWSRLQELFVDQPEKAVRDAHALVQEVMRKSGYPLADFEQSAADLSVDHPYVVENYRKAIHIAQRSESAPVSTEELRQALVCYRALFKDLLEVEEPASKYDNGEKTSARPRQRGPNAHPTH